jgi:hypothetical protein
VISAVSGILPPWEIPSGDHLEMQDQCQRERITMQGLTWLDGAGGMPFWRSVTEVCQSLIPDNSPKNAAGRGGCTGALLVRVQLGTPANSAGPAVSKT